MTHCHIHLKWPWSLHWPKWIASRSASATAHSSQLFWQRIDADAIKKERLRLKLFLVLKINLKSIPIFDANVTVSQNAIYNPSLLWSKVKLIYLFQFHTASCWRTFSIATTLSLFELKINYELFNVNNNPLFLSS